MLCFANVDKWLRCLAQVEDLLKVQAPDGQGGNRGASDAASLSPKPAQQEYTDPMPDMAFPMDQGNMTSMPFDASQQQPLLANLSLGSGDEFSWEMIGLGLDEPLPSQEIIDELFVTPESHYLSGVTDGIAETRSILKRCIHPCLWCIGRASWQQ